MVKPRVLYWFRTDLRLHDSPALKAALDLHPECLYPIWTWDPHYVYRARVGANRWKFLLDCQNDLSASITALNPKSKLFVIREAPVTLLPKLFKRWKITHLVFEKDTDAYGRERDDDVTRLAQDAGVEVLVRLGRTLWDPDALVQKNSGKPTMSLTQTMKAGAKVGRIPRHIPAPQSLPDPGNTTLDFDQDRPPAEPDLNAIQRDGADQSYQHLAGPQGDFAVPTMAELRLKPATTPHRGGERVARKMLDDIIADTTYTATFEKPNTAPTAFAPQATTLLSPHLHFGSISCREFYWRVQDVVDAYKGPGKASQPPTSLTGQVLFRDMYFGAQAALGHKFGQTVGNPQCRFVPWLLPSTVDPASGLITGEHEVDSDEAERWFQAWKHGRTGFPWIDGLMRQLKQEGWIHHLGRHSVAAFLTRGGCYISWERGAEVFEEWLLDHEPACNIGNWQWLSCTAFYAMYYRVYSPVAFPQKWDKDGHFIRHYVPELKDYPTKYIFEPWKAPVVDQKKAGCLVKTVEETDVDATTAATTDTADGGRDDRSAENGALRTYPAPIFDFATQREKCMRGMKAAYSANLYGDDARVLDGSWRSLFPADSAARASTTSASKGNGKRPAGGKGKGQGTLDGHMVKRSKKNGA
ncbi:MAG: hypothetical protein M1838_001424 [Thelocarpon superellum]|nr:MAG: hypothetical protein M1838_001424 [Thelocarpon superellum]